MPSRADPRADERRLPLWLTAAIVLLAAGLSARLAPEIEESVGTGRDRDITRAPRGPRGDVSLAAAESGRHATTPADIPARGWKQILLRVYNDISKHRILAIAAGVTFYALLAVFPAIAALVALYGLFADPGAISQHLDRLTTVLPGGAIDVVRDQTTRVASQPHGALGATFAAGLVSALWSANAGVKALFDAFNVVYDEEETRGFVRLNATSLAFTGGGLVMALLAIGAVVVLPAALNYIGLTNRMEWIIRLGTWPVMLLVVTLMLALMYRYGPDRRRPRWRWITWGSAFAAFAWLIASVLFSWYAANFGTFNKTYGSLGAVIGFMTWIWISAIVVLIGAELNAQMERQTSGGTADIQRRAPGPRRH